MGSPSFLVFKFVACVPTPGGVSVPLLWVVGPHGACLSSAISTLVRKVIWDGGNAHVVLFGADEGEVEFPDMGDRIAHLESESDEEENLEAFEDLDYRDVEEEALVADSKADWREDSK